MTVPSTVSAPGPYPAVTWFQPPPAWARSRPTVLRLRWAPQVEHRSGSTQLRLLNGRPPIHQLFLAQNLATYGAAVRPIREARVRWKKGWTTVLRLGAAYGVLPPCARTPWERPEPRSSREGSAPPPLQGAGFDAVRGFPGRSASGRTIRTAACVWWTTASDTLPRKRRRAEESPREPITTRSASGAAGGVVRGSGPIAI